MGAGRVASVGRRRLVGRLRQAVGPGNGSTGSDPRPGALVPVPRRRGPELGKPPFVVPATPGFTGRCDELTRLIAAPDGLLRRHRVVVLAGGRGVGTSWLLLRAGHDSWDAGLLPDGRVHVDLRPADGPPLTGRQALQRMAELAGAGELASSGSDADAANHLRRRLAGRRILFLVDNVLDPEQLGPLLAAQCHLLVAGGPALLAGVPGAAVVEVGPLDRRDAVELCEQSHPRRHREPRADYERAVATIGRLFAGQPKVLYELGGRGDRRRPPAAELALGLQRVLDAPPYVAVELPDAVEAACRHHAAYATLSDGARRVARLLAMVADPLPPAAVAALTLPGVPRRRGPGLGAAAPATGLAPTPPARRPPWRRRPVDDAGSTHGRPGRAWAAVEAALTELDAAGFLERRGDDLRLAPGLARLCRLHLHRDEPERRRLRAWVRLLRHLAGEAARQAEQLAAPAVVEAAGGRVSAADRAAARTADEWFDRHRRLLHHVVTAPLVRHAGDTGRWRRTARITGARWTAGGQVEVALPKSRRSRRAWWELARALQAWYDTRGHDHRARALARAVRTVATAVGLPGVEGWAAHRLAVVALRRGEWQRAVDELAGLHRRWGRVERAPALTNRGVAHLHLGRVEAALDDLQAARRLRSRRDPVGMGLTDLALGEAWYRSDRPDRARTHLVAAANAFDGVDETGLAAALANLVLVEAALGRMPVALRTAGEAERVHRALGDDAGAAEVRLNTAIALLSLDPPRPEQADELLTGLITDLADGPPTALLARVLLHAGDAARLRDRPATARLLWARAADTGRQAHDAATATAAQSRLGT